MRIFVGIEINSNPMMQGHLIVSGVVGHPSQAVLSFAKRREVYRCPDRRRHIFRLINTGHFSSIAIFNRSKWEKYFSEFNT